MKRFLALMLLFVLGTSMTNAQSTKKYDGPMKLPWDLYMFMRTEDIAALNQAAELQRMQIISPDGPANHMRREVNALTEEQFKQFINYQMTVCEREDLLGASAHTVDILKK